MLMPRDGGEGVHWWGTITSAKLFANAEPVVCSEQVQHQLVRCQEEEPGRGAGGGGGG